MGDTYTHGHHASVLRSHTWRTAENSAAHLLPSLRAGQRLLDVGCGPGNITLDLARRVAPGEVIGVDLSAEVVAHAEAALVEAARAEAASTEPDPGPTETAWPQNVSFRVDDVYALRADDASFDVVHAHQVLQHLTDPVAALTEMHRVLRPGGVLAVRDSDYASMAWAPDNPMLDRWMELYHQVTERNGAEADAGRYLLGWVQGAGFTDATMSSSTWTYAGPETRAWWGDLWAERVLESAFARQAVDYGLSERSELEAISAAWRRWSEADDAVFIAVHGEVLANKS